MNPFRVRFALAGLLAVLASGTFVSSALSATSQRLEGPTRYDTAAAIARATFTSPRDVVIASGQSFADALSATNLMHKSYYQGPVLLTTRDALAPATRDYLSQRHPTRAFILGGTAAISQRVEDEIRALGVEAVRIAGRDRYETATFALGTTYNFEASSPGTVDGKRTVIMASGESFADALAAGPLSYAADLPIVLTRRDSIPPATRDYLDQDGRYAQQFLIVGGTNVVSDSVASELRRRGYAVRRVAGTTRQGTAVAVADLLASVTRHPAHVILARGDTFPDALAAGVHGGVEQAPILLTVDPTQLGQVTEDWLRRNSAAIDTLHVIGDTTAISDPVVRQAERAAG